MRRGSPFTLSCAIALVLAFAACRPATTSVPPAATDEIRLVRTQCFGRCPSYSVVVRGDGAVAYDGLAFVKVEGSATAMLSASDVTALFAAAEKARLFELDDDYSTNCPEFWTDNPSEELTVHLGSRTKTVSRNFGCHGVAALKRLDAFCDRVDEVAGTRAWVGR